ncbi:MAG TPA: DoxX family protein [Chloroflexia bacterium]|nr:DoxX family protein [Chloroflexia bacterium]
MDLVLWVLQGLVALVFLFAGILKLTQPVQRLGNRMEFVNEVPEWVVRLIGLAELLGGCGLILPTLSGVATWLTPLAALGLALVMLLASGFHSRRGEYSRLPVTLVLLGLAVSVAVGRYLVVPF